MKRDLNSIVNDYIIKSDYRALIVETEEIIKENPKSIIELIDLLNNQEVEFEWKRNQIRERFLYYLSLLEDDTQIKVTYEVARRYLEQIDIKELADKLCFFVSQDKLLNQIIKTKSEKRLEQFNRLLINELLLRGKSFSEDEKKIIIDSFSDFDFNWMGLELEKIEMGLPLRSYIQGGGGSSGIIFGLQSEEKFPYSFSDFSSIVLNKNTNTELNVLASMIAKEYIRLVEFGDFECFEEDIHDLEAEIICQLNYAENLSEDLKITFRGINARDVYKYLFNMALFGGAYERGEYGATSRINSWKVISGLIQKNYFESNKTDILKGMNEFVWTEFNCENNWFANEWIDLGIIGINHLEKKYAVIVISDTD
ncbi:DUF6183 family protein [Haliscomenobacter hydrossis]|uniref:Uncharacterized protein n=1 Tax=Haliscomenobacter hydrossis (strain ATCC 27775 / DSM 1100 / LMG 10767 / O) TaxID=760192 RepID=F4L5Z5_HALH1|nr:DUF6183 family protein [Haliscomenobacter hydrossis]AEE53055.1 hypothetical protein Halhy_5229 [Haliscomenobacter hydrossis DSM 1100]